MKQSDYVNLLLNGYFNHREYLVEYIFRECKEAEKKHIEFGEFFKRLFDTNNTFIEAIKANHGEELRKYSLCRSQMNYDGTWKDEYEQSKPEVWNFSAHLFSLTHSNYTGHLFGNDVKFIYDAIVSAFEKIEAEKMPKLAEVDNLPPLEQIFDATKPGYSICLELFEELEFVDNKGNTNEGLKAGDIMGLIDALKRTDHNLIKDTRWRN